MFTYSLKYLCFLSVTFATVLATATEPANHASILTPYVNGDTFAVAYVDIVPIKVSENPGELLNILPALQGDAQSLALGAKIVEGFVRRFQTAGGQGLYAVAGLADIHIDGSPLFVATSRPGEKPEKIEQLFKDMIQEIASDATQVVARPIAQKLDVQRKDRLVLLGMKATVARYMALKATPRTDLIDPLVKRLSEGAVAAAVYCPGQDYRRVIRELWPQLPGSLAPLRAELADRWLYFDFAVNLPPDARPRIALQARDPEAAETFVTLWNNLPNAVTEFGGNEQSLVMVKGFAQMLVNALPAKVEGTRVEIVVPPELPQLAKLSFMLGTAAEKSMEVTRNKQRMMKFKEIMLGMLNHESARKRLPPAAICDKDGKPLLSWRVAILPYIEQNALYKQFHLDEPWDSPHNRPLVEMMPKIFADPNPTLAGLAREGKTTFQVPVGLETIFFNSDGAKIREITDGTSQTIALVEVEPQRAVFWTQPEDWTVDLEHPLNGLRRSDRNFITAARCDGSVQTIPTNTEEKSLRALLTRKGGEIIDRQ